MDTTISVLLFATGAALVSAAGVLPLAFRESLPRLWLGWSNALAAGMMLGAAYSLMTAGIQLGLSLEAAAGAVVGAVFVFGVHGWSGTGDLDLNRLDNQRPEYGYQVMVSNTLHSGCEGVAIGAAMSVSLPFGIFVVAATAIHNIPEATVLGTILRARGVRLPDAAGLAIVTNVSQVLLAVVTFAVVEAAPAALPLTIGFGVGSLIYLTMADLLPESYREAGPTTIALVTIAAMGVVVLIRGFGL